jgi:hypothetical protein
MIKYTPQLLKQLEEVFAEIGYKVRYEKGNFKSGYCILENQKVVLLNKFTVMESRISTLIEILRYLSSQEEMTGDKFMQFSKKYFSEAEATKSESEN